MVCSLVIIVLLLNLWCGYICGPSPVVVAGHLEHMARNSDSPRDWLEHETIFGKEIGGLREASNTSIFHWKISDSWWFLMSQQGFQVKDVGTAYHQSQTDFVVVLVRLHTPSSPQHNEPPNKRQSEMRQH